MSVAETITGEQPARRGLAMLRRGPLIWQMIGLALALHLVLLLVFSPRLLSSGEDSPERLYQRGEAELAQGHFSEAMGLFQKVMDQQPKLPPVFEKAAEQHRTAERMARQYTPKPAATREAGTEGAGAMAGVTSKPAGKTPDKPPVTGGAGTRPVTPFVPPELRPK